ncbi:hypothetical protein HOLleu_25014 [Holothuria leucospilota]|uniref:Uncharacterized protein n=1 Tax=Holothuria leucospilota TaxID=206669 RepID=A0A9Q1H484_HOLLE|nr:hypothetical protein HOLleu_25014 [Holothuria leucospilota]
MVELLPNNLILLRPAHLSLPHCLILRKTDASEVQVFHSHHAKGTVHTLLLYFNINNI